MQRKALFALSPQELMPRTVKLDDISLDPNNPRFNPPQLVPDDKIHEETVQAQALDEIRKLGVSNLMESIQRLGFLSIDKIVVRTLPDGKYVVVEGNRRIAALKLLKNSGLPLRPEVLKSIQEFEAIVYTGRRRDISWLVQGIRHISGIKGWGGLEQGELIYKLVEEAKMEINDAAKAIGISPTRALRQLKSYYGYLQFKEDEEWGDSLDPKNFVFFIDGIFGRTGRTKFQDWLKWNDNAKRFKDQDKVKEFFSWIVPPEEGKEPIISSRGDFMELEKALKQYPSIFEKFREDRDFEYLRREVVEREYMPQQLDSLRGILEDSVVRLKSLPTIAIKTSGLKREFVKLLKQIELLAREHLVALGD